MKSSTEKPRVKLTIDTHTRVKTWASANRTTIERAVEQAIELLTVAQQTNGDVAAKP